MRSFFLLVLSAFSIALSGCNTIGGLGQDVSEAGKALDNAAYWSQNQLHTLNQEMTTTNVNDGSDGYFNDTALSIEDANTARQY